MPATPYTIIPSSQPSCGDITPLQPIPHCPNTTNPANPNTSAEPMGCFFQTNGLFCAPIATTRGFLYTPDTTLQQTQQQQQQHNQRVLPFLVPTLSTATNNNSTNTSLPLLGIDGQPVNFQGPARLGETCYPLPLPPTADPLFQTLVAVANLRLNETLAGEGTEPGLGGGGGWSHSPGVGAGFQVFDFRGDCERGSYCDFVPSTAGGSSISGICKEVLPNFHNCTSYAQCSSLYCDRPLSEGSRNSTAGNTNGGGGGITICLPSRLDPGNTNGGGGGGKDKSSKFPAWIGGIIAIVVVFGAAIIFGLVRRKKKMAADKEKKTMKKKRRSARSQAAATERRRSMSLPLHSHHHHQQQHDQEQQYHQDEEDDKESEYVYQLHSAEPSLAISEKQDLSATGGRQEGGGGFGSWFRRSRTEDPMDRELGETTSRTTRSSPSSVRSSLSEDVQRLATNHSSALSLDMKEVEAIHQSHLQHPTDYSAGSPPGGYTVPLNTSGAAAAVSGEAAAGSIHSDSTTAVVLDSTGPRSRLSVNIPGIFTTPSDSAAAAAAAAASVAASSSAQGAFTEDDEKDVASELSYSKNLNNRPSFSSATSSSEGGFSSPPSDRFRRSSSTHAFLTAIPSPGSPISPISPISPRPPLSSGSSSRSSQRQSMQTPARRT